MQGRGCVRRLWKAELTTLQLVTAGPPLPQNRTTMDSNRKVCSYEMRGRMVRSLPAVSSALGKLVQRANEIHR